MIRFEAQFNLGDTAFFSDAPGRACKITIMGIFFSKDDAGAISPNYMDERGARHTEKDLFATLDECCDQLLKNEISRHRGAKERIQSLRGSEL